MSGSKLLRLFSLFLCLLLLVANFSVVASAADGENLVTNNLFINLSDYDSELTPLYNIRYSDGSFHCATPIGPNYPRSGIFFPCELIKGEKYKITFTLSQFVTTYLIGYVGYGYLSSDSFEFADSFTAFTKDENLNDTFSFEFEVSENLNNSGIIIYFESLKSYSSESVFSFDLSNFSVIHIQTPSEKKLDGILGWLQELWNSIKDGFSNLGGKLSELGSGITDNFNRFWDTLAERLDVSEGYLVEIKSFFHDLYWDLVGGTCKYGDVHSSLFERLGNRIGGFFDDLKLKIDLKVEEIKTSIHDFFVPPEGFFDNWKMRFNSMLEHNLGFVYQAPNFVVQVVNCIQDVINTKTEPNLVFPKVEFDIVGYHVVLFEDTAVDFSFLDSGIWATVYGMYKVMVHAILAFALIKFAQDTWERTMSN